MLKDLQILGEYTDEARVKPLSQTSLIVDSVDMTENWRRVSLTSDFMAKYYSYYFPYREKAKERISREAAENSISFVLNELIENTAKYTDSANKTVTVKILLLEEHIIFQVSNFVTPGPADSFFNLARDILESNPEELYIKRLEKNTEADSGDSGLGYLTLINDYGVAMGFRFEKQGQDLFRVTVQARMKCREE
jgi:hypothetical protein